MQVKSNLRNNIVTKKSQAVPMERKCNSHTSYPQTVPLEQKTFRTVLVYPALVRGGDLNKHSPMFVAHETFATFPNICITNIICKLFSTATKRKLKYLFRVPLNVGRQLKICIYCKFILLYKHFFKCRKVIDFVKKKHCLFIIGGRNAAVRKRGTIITH